MEGRYKELPYARVQLWYFLFLRSSVLLALTQSIISSKHCRSHTTQPRTSKPIIIIVVKMKLSSIICLLTAASTSLAATETVSYDQGYDQAGRAMTAVACSDGANGLITSTPTTNPKPFLVTNLSPRIRLPDPRSHSNIPTYRRQWYDFRLERSSMRHLLQSDVQGQEYLRFGY